MAKRDREFWESARQNNACFIQYYRRLVELSICMFEWKNLPETIDPRFMELTLFSEGQAIFFKDEVLGYLCLQNIQQGNLDVYRTPKDRRAYAVNGYQKQLNEEDSVIIYNNFLRTNSMLDVSVFAERLSDIDRTIDVNMRAQKTPVLIQCDETQRLTMTNLYKEYNGNQPFIFGDKHLNKDGITVLQTGAPFISPELYELKEKYWGEALTYLGISGIKEKQERMIVGELTASQGSVISCRYSRLKPRQEAAKKINEMFGLNISVDYHQDYQVPNLNENDTEDDMDKNLPHL